MTSLITGTRLYQIHLRSREILSGLFRFLFFMLCLSNWMGESLIWRGSWHLVAGGAARWLHAALMPFMPSMCRFPHRISVFFCLPLKIWCLCALFIIWRGSISIYCDFKTRRKDSQICISDRGFTVVQSGLLNGKCSVLFIAPFTRFIQSIRIWIKRALFADARYFGKEKINHERNLQKSHKQQSVKRSRKRTRL